MKGAVISTDYLFYLTNHDQAHTSLWGCRFEQWMCATIGPLSFTSPLLLEWRSSEKYSPLFTKGNTQFSHNEIHSTQIGFTTPPMANHCSAPFSMRRIRDISSLTPRIQFCETRRERFCRGSEVESGIFHYCWTQLPSAWIRSERGCGGKYSRRARRFSALATTVWETKKGT